MAGGDYRETDEKKQCGFDLNSLGPCAPGDDTSVFGYKENAPCLYLRLSKVSGYPMQQK